MLFELLSKRAHCYIDSSLRMGLITVVKPKAVMWWMRWLFEICMYKSYYINFFFAVWVWASFACLYTFACLFKKSIGSITELRLHWYIHLLVKQFSMIDFIILYIYVSICFSIVPIKYIQFEELSFLWSYSNQQPTYSRSTMLRGDNWSQQL